MTLPHRHAAESRRPAPLQPRARSRGDPDQSIRWPRKGTHLHIAHRAAEWVTAAVVQAADAVDVCLWQKMGAPEGGLGTALRLLQLLPGSWDSAGHSRNGSWPYESAMGHCGIAPLGMLLGSRRRHLALLQPNLRWSDVGDLSSNAAWLAFAQEQNALIPLRAEL
jgi:hypothetical protein